MRASALPFQPLLIGLAVALVAGAGMAQTSPGAQTERPNERSNPGAQSAQTEQSEEDDTRAAPKREDDGALQDRIRALGGEPGQGPAKPLGGSLAAVEGEDDFIDLLNEGAAKSGFSPGSGPLTSQDRDAQIQWDQALGRETEIQKHLEHEFSRMQTDVARAINDYLAASSTWQDRYALIASSTTGMQGLLADWQESKGIYEKADFAFAMANLGMGAGKLSFKAYRWFTKAPAVVETLASGTEAAADLSKTQVFDKVLPLPTAEAGADLTQTQKFTKVLKPPPAGSIPVAPGGQYSPIAAVSEAGDDLRKSSAGLTALGQDTVVAEQQYADQVRKMERLLAKARREKMIDVANRIEADLKALRAQGPTAPLGASAKAASAVQSSETGAFDKIVNTLESSAKASNTALGKAKFGADAKAMRQLGDAAREAGVDPNKVVEAYAKEAAARTEAAKQAAIAAGDDPALVDSAYSASEAAQRVVNAVAKARGWHAIPRWGQTAVTNLLIQTRQVLAGVRGAQISPQTLELVKTLQTEAKINGMSLGRYLETSASEVEIATTGFDNGEKVMEGASGVVLHFDAADAKLVEQVLQSGGDVGKLRQLASPIEQVSLNALARANPGYWANQGKTGAALTQSLNQVGGVQSAVKPTDVGGALTATGGLGAVGLDNFVDQFGVTQRYAASSNLFTASLNETWEFISSPSATVASHYYTNVAISQISDLVATRQSEFVDLGVQLDNAARALRDLQSGLHRAGAGNPASYLNKGAQDDLQKALDDLQKAFDGGSAGWKRDHKGEMEARRAHIQGKMQDLKSAMEAVDALAGRAQNLRDWLDSVRLDPVTKTPKTPLQAFNPETFVRLGSISLYLRAIAASEFGLVQDKPFHVVPAADGPSPQGGGDVKVHGAVKEMIK